MAVIALGLGTLQAGAGLVLTATTLSVSVANSVVIAGAGNGSVQLSGDAASPGNNYVYATDGSGVKGWRALSAFGVTTVAGTAGQVLVNGGTTAASGAVTLTLAAALVSITSVTAGTGNALTLTGGDSGASLTLGALSGGNASVTIMPKGTGVISTARPFSQSSGGALAVTINQTRTTASDVAGTAIGQWIGFQNTTEVAAVETQSDGATDSGRIAFYTRAAGATNAVKGLLTSTGNLLIGGTTDIAGSGGLKVFGTTASTSTTTGSLINAGGFGNAGDLWNGGSLYLSGHLRVTGATGSFVANETAVDHNSSTARVLGFGPDATTRPGFAVYLATSNNSSGITPFSISNTGAATLTGNLTVSGTGTHTFGTTNTVTMAAGALTATGNLTAQGGAHVFGKSGAGGTANPYIQILGDYLTGTTQTSTLYLSPGITAGNGPFIQGYRIGDQSVNPTGRDQGLKLSVVNNDVDTLAVTIANDATVTLAGTLTASGTGTHAFGTTAGGIISLPSTTGSAATGGLLFGADTNLYRSAANTLATDDNVTMTLATATLTLGTATEIGSLAVSAAGALTITPKSGQNVTVASGTGGFVSSGTGTSSFAGILQANATTEATTGGAGAFTTTGGIYATKRLVTATDLFVTGGQSWGITSTATAAGTTTLTNASKTVQIFTGTTTQTVQLPAANATGAGYAIVYVIKNRSTAAITVQRAGTDSLENGTSTTLNSGDAVFLCSDGVSNWSIV